MTVESIDVEERRETVDELIVLFLPFNVHELVLPPSVPGCKRASSRPHLVPGVSRKQPSRELWPRPLPFKWLELNLSSSSSSSPLFVSDGQGLINGSSSPVEWNSSHPSWSSGETNRTNRTSIDPNRVDELDDSSSAFVQTSIPPPSLLSSPSRFLFGLSTVVPIFEEVFFGTKDSLQEGGREGFVPTAPFGQRCASSSLFLDLAPQMLSSHRERRAPKEQAWSVRFLIAGSPSKEPS